MSGLVGDLLIQKPFEGVVSRCSFALVYFVKSNQKMRLHAVRLVYVIIADRNPFPDRDVGVQTATYVHPRIGPLVQTKRKVYIHKQVSFAR